MKPWKDLSMKERGAFIRVGVKNGITSVDGIRDAYNKFACGGHKFDGTSEPTQRLYQNSQGNLLSQDQYNELVWRAKNNADVAAVNDYREVQVPVRQQQPVNDRMFEGNLNEITVRPDIAYNSDVRNIPALETTEEPISDEIRRRYATSVGQQRRQAQMTPAEQWANYYNNLFNLSYEDRKALENDRKFKRFIGGVAGGLITAPVTIPAIASSTAYAPEAYSWLMQKGLPAATEFMSTKLNPGWWIDQATLDARQLAQRYGLSALESGLSALTGEVGLSGMAGGFSGFGSSTIPGMALNAYLGAEMGYDAFNNLINKPFGSPDRTWKDNFWDALGLTGGIATGAEMGLQSAPEIINTGIKSLEGINTAYNKTYRRARNTVNKTRKYINAKERIEKLSEKFPELFKEIRSQLDRTYRKRDVSYNQVMKRLDDMKKETSRKLRLINTSKEEEIPEVAEYKKSLNIEKLREDYNNSGFIDDPTDEYLINDAVHQFTMKLYSDLLDRDNLIQNIRNSLRGGYIANTWYDPSSYGRASIDLQKASYKDLEAFAKKHKLNIEDSFREGDHGEVVIKVPEYKGSGASVATTFKSGEGDVPIFGDVNIKDLKKEHFSVELVASSKTGGFEIAITPTSSPDDIAMTLYGGAGRDVSHIEETVAMTPGYREVIQKNIEYLEKLFGAKSIGSSSVKGIPHWSDDFDLIMTEEQVAKKIPGYLGMLNDRGHLNVDLGEYEGKGRGFYTTDTQEKPNHNFGEIDINVIQADKDGNATGFIADELFRQFFPEEYSKAAVEASLNGGQKHVKINKTPQELYDAFDSEVKTIMDCLETGGTDRHFSYIDKSKQAPRIFGYIKYGDNKTVAKAIQKAGEMQVGKYRKAPNFDFTNVENNRVLLRRMGIPYMDFADDPEKMQNMFDYYCLNRTTVYRGIGGNYPDFETLSDVFEVWPNQGGSMNGYGTNNVGGAASQYGGSFVRIRQLPAKYEGASSPMEVLDNIDRATGRNLKLTAKEAAYINSKVDVNLRKTDVKEGATALDLIWLTPTTDGWEQLSKALMDLGIYSLPNGRYNGGTYMSVANNIPLKTAEGIPSVPHYFHQPLEYMVDIERRVPKSVSGRIYDKEPITALHDKKGSHLLWTPNISVPIDVDMPFFDIAKKNISGFSERTGKLNKHYDVMTHRMSKWGVDKERNEYHGEKYRQVLHNINYARDMAKTIGGVLLGGAIIGAGAYGLGMGLSHIDSTPNDDTASGRYVNDRNEIYKEINDLDNAHINEGLLSEEEWRSKRDALCAELEELENLVEDKRISHIKDYDSDRARARRQRAEEEKNNKKNKKNKKSYGGSLNLNDQYGIGKYINY